MGDEARSRDAPAAEVYARRRDELVHFLQRLCGDRGVAEDLAQEAGLRLVAAMRTETIVNPPAYLFHVATNLARDALRRRAFGVAAADVESATTPGADHVSAAREEVDRVSAALVELPRRARDVLVLSRIEGLSQKQVASRLGIARKTVENHLTRALALLAQRLRDGDRS